MAILIHQRAIIALQEHFVGSTLRVIEQAFDAEGITRDQAFIPTVPGERRARFQQYMHSLNLSNPRDVRRVLNVFESVLADLERGMQDPAAFIYQYASKTFHELCRLLKRDGYDYQDGRITAPGRTASLDELQEAISSLDLPHLQRQIERMREAADADPWLAIGTAKEMVETTCKTILSARGVILSGKPEIPELIKATRETLQLMPDQVPSRAKGANTIKRLLSNLGTIAQNLAELRRDYGTGHGQDGRAKGLDPRHARLAVNSAVTLATFLIETHQAKPIIPSPTV